MPPKWINEIKYIRNRSCQNWVDLHHLGCKLSFNLSLCIFRLNTYFLIFKTIEEILQYIYLFKFKTNSLLCANVEIVVWKIAKYSNSYDECNRTKIWLKGNQNFITKRQSFKYLFRLSLSLEMLECLSVFCKSRLQYLSLPQAAIITTIACSFARKYFILLVQTPSYIIGYRFVESSV